MKLFSQNLKIVRKGKGISQAEMGEKFGVSQSSYGRWESDASEPNLSTVVELCQYLKVPVGDMLTKDLSTSPITLMDSEGKKKELSEQELRLKAKIGEQLMELEDIRTERAELKRQELEMAKVLMEVMPYIEAALEFPQYKDKKAEMMEKLGKALERKG